MIISVFFGENMKTGFAFNHALPETDKFLACALAAKAKTVISGDKLLLDVSGYRGIEIYRPREFLDRYLSET